MSHVKAEFLVLVHLYVQFVDNLLATLASFRPELQELLQQLQDQMQLTAQASQAEAAKFSSGGKGATASRKQTVPEPFNLTQPKPKLLPIEEPLPSPIKYCSCYLCTQLQCCSAAKEVRLVQTCLCSRSYRPSFSINVLCSASRSSLDQIANQSQLNIIKLLHMHSVSIHHLATHALGRMTEPHGLAPVSVCSICLDYF